MEKQVDLSTMLWQTLLVVGTIVVFAISSLAVFGMVWLATTHVARWVWKSLRGGQWRTNNAREDDPNVPAVLAGALNSLGLLLIGLFYWVDDKDMDIAALGLPNILLADLFGWAALCAVAIILEALCLVAWNSIEKLRASRWRTALDEEEGLTKDREEAIELGSPV